MAKNWKKTIFKSSMKLPKAKISKLSDLAEIENLDSPDPTDSKNADFVNFRP